jgi:hypothetical protein
LVTGITCHPDLLRPEFSARQMEAGQAVFIRRRLNKLFVKYVDIGEFREWK